MEIRSPAFQEGQIIPSTYTCEGKNISPPLQFLNVPKEAKSLVLFIDDPDVPVLVRPDCNYDHWVIYNIPPTTPHLEEGCIPPGIQGKSTNGKNQYTGPCPPDKEHRYFFKLYALNTLLHLPPGSTKAQVEQAMEGHILQAAMMIARYEKGKGY